MTDQLYSGNREPSREKLQEVFHYRNNELYWKSSGKGRRVNFPAGTVNARGYRYIMISGKSYLAHRLVWAYHGKIPVPLLDHANGNKSDNRIENLRVATYSQNCMNRQQRSDNTSGVKGVGWDFEKDRWRVRIAVGGKTYEGGRFVCKERAKAAAEALRRRLHGDYARC